MSTAKVVLRPESEAPRTTWQGRRGTTNYVSNSVTADNTTALRLQRLRLIGIIGARADMLAHLAWGEAA